LNGSSVHKNPCTVKMRTFASAGMSRFTSDSPQEKPIEEERQYRSERMPKKKPRGLVDYGGQPSVIRNFFEILPETDVKEARKRAKKK